MSKKRALQKIDELALLLEEEIKNFYYSPNYELRIRTFDMAMAFNKIKDKIYEIALEVKSK